MLPSRSVRASRDQGAGRRTGAGRSIPDARRRRRRRQPHRRRAPWRHPALLPAQGRLARVPAMTDAPLKFCVNFSHRSWEKGDPTAPSRLIALARAADEGGADSIWVSEDPEGWDAFAVLGALAVETKRARVGVGVTN